MFCEGCHFCKEIDIDKKECTCEDNCQYCPNLTAKEKKMKCDFCEYAEYDIDAPEVEAICKCNEDCKECPRAQEFDCYIGEE